MGISGIALALLTVAGLATAFSLSGTHQEGKKVVCYFGSWATYRPGEGKFDVENIDPMICTHLIFGFAGLGLDNKIYALDAYNELEENWGKGAYKRFTKLKQRNPALKTLLAIGGWNEGSEKYSAMAASPASRQTFIESVVPYLQHEGFDGLDLDWEYPSQRGGKPEDRANFATLCQELRTEFNKHGFLLTAAVSAGQYTIDDAYDVPSIAQSLDFINVMSYDFRGAWEHHPYTGHHSAFEAMSIDVGNDSMLNTKHAINYWIESGAPAEKLILGMGTYGRGFTLNDPTNTGFYSPATLGIPAGPYTRESGFWGYNEICDEILKGGWTIVREEHVAGPYAFKNNWWIGYDDAESIRVKSEWVKEVGLGGGMFWSVETDDFHGKCGETNELMKTAYRVLVGEILPEPSTTTTTQDPTAPTTTTTTKPTPPPDGVCRENGEFLGELCDPSFTICNWDGDSWQYIVYTCSAGLLYDPAIKSCNWADVIGCVRK